MVLDKMNKMYKEGEERAVRLHDAVDRLTKRYDSWEKSLERLEKAVNALTETIEKKL